MRDETRIGNGIDDPELEAIFGKAPEPKPSSQMLKPYDPEAYKKYGVMAETAWLLETLNPRGPWNLTHKHPTVRGMLGRTFPVGTDMMEIARWGKEQNDAGRNVYFSVNTPRPGSPNKKLAKTDIASINAVFNDSDVTSGKTREQELEEIGAKFDGCRLKPISVMTGNGVQAIWPLDKPLEATPGNKERVERLGEAISQILGGDPVQNVDRVMRASGTMNYPTEPKTKRGLKRQRSYLRSTDGVRRYSLEKLEAQFKPNGSLPNGGGGARKARRGGKGQDSKKLSAMEKTVAAELDMDKVDAVMVTGLPKELLDRFDSLKARVPSVKRLWDTGEIEGPDGTVTVNDGSVIIIFLANIMHGNGFTVTEFGMVAQTLPYGGNKGLNNDDGSGNADERSLVRAWAKAVLRQGLPQDAFVEIDDVEIAGIVLPDGDDDDDDDDEPLPDEPDADIEREDITPERLKVSGLVDEIAEWIMSTAPIPQLLYATAAALAVVGTILQRETFTADMPTGTNLYHVALGRTGSGKQHQIDNIKKLLDAATAATFGMDKSLHDGWMVSSAMLITRLSERRTMLQIVDEFADRLSGLRQKSVNEATHLSEAYRELSGISTSDYKPSEALSRKTFDIHRPALGMWACCTDTAFEQMLTGITLGNGLLGRFLLWPIYKDPPYRKRKQSGQQAPFAVPQALAGKLQALFAAVHSTGLPPAQPPAPRLSVPMTSEAFDMDEANREFQLAKMRLSDEYREMALYARYAEHIKRIALIAACGKHYADVNKAVINKDDMTFAHGLVSWSIRQAIVMVRDSMAENETQYAYKRIRRMIFDAGAKSGISRRDIDRKISGRLTGKQIDEAILQLKGGKYIRGGKKYSGKKGRPSERYYPRK